MNGTSLQRADQLGVLFQQARQKLGVSQLYVVVTLGCQTVQFLSRIEQGKKIPSASLAARLAKILELDLKLVFAKLLQVHQEKLSQEFNTHVSSPDPNSVSKAGSEALSIGQGASALCCS